MLSLPSGQNKMRMLFVPIRNGGERRDLHCYMGLEPDLDRFDMRSILCYAIVLPGRKLVSRVGFWPDCYREDTEIGPPAGRRPAGGPISVSSRLQSGQSPRAGSTTA